MAKHIFPQHLPDFGIIGNHFSDDVIGPLKGIGDGFHPLFWVYIIFRRRCGFGAGGGLCEEELRQRLQPLLSCHGGPGTAFLLIGTVEVLHLGQSGGGVDGGGEFLRQFALFLDGAFDLLPPLVQIAKVVQPVGQVPEDRVVHGPVHLLAVPGNEGDGVALIQKGHHIVYIILRLAQFASQKFDDLLHEDSPCGVYLWLGSIIADFPFWDKGKRKTSGRFGRMGKVCAPPTGQNLYPAQFCSASRFDVTLRKGLGAKALSRYDCASRLPIPAGSAVRSAS